MPVSFNKNQLKTLFRVLLYISIIFLIWYLYRADYLILSEISFNYYRLFASLMFLFAGFIISTSSWTYALRVHGYKTSYYIGLVSHGLSVFAKYIPGKIWVIIGRASYLSGGELPFKVASIVSLKEQLIYLLWGLTLSVFPIIFFLKLPVYGIIVLLTIIFIGFVLFSAWFHNRIVTILSKLLGRPVDLPLLSFGDALKISGFVIFYWITWTVAFYLLLISVYPDSSFIMSFAFPVSVVYGVMAILMPGGIGIREGILVLFLTSSGMPADAAVTISVISRLWFISGEVFLFVLSLLIKFFYKVAGYPEYPSTLRTTKTESH